MKNLFILLFLFSFSNAFSQLNLGGELIYEINGNTASFRLKLLSACGTTVPATRDIQISDGSAPGSLTLNKILTYEVTGHCGQTNDTTFTNCGSGSFPGHYYSEYTGSTTIVFTTNCIWTASYQQCCRPAYNNVNTGDLFLFAEFNICNSQPKNSSAPMRNYPVINVCKDQLNTISLAPVEVNNVDSFYYSLATPKEDLLTNLTYISPYTFDKPIQFLDFPNTGAPLPGGFHLNHQTGDLSFTPTFLMLANITIEVSEWRKINGTMQYLGKSRRDIPLKVIDCDSNQLPQLISSAPEILEFCPTKQNCITINTMDSNSLDTVMLSYSSSSVNVIANMNNGSTAHPSITLCYNPPVADTNTIQYLTITAEDNNCPLLGRTSKTYIVKVKNYVPVHTRQIVKTGCSNFDFTAQLIDPAANYKWIIGQDTLSGINVSRHFTFPGNFIVQLLVEINGCTRSFYDTAKVTQLPVNITVTPDTIVCQGTNLQLNTTISSGTGPFRYLWNTGNIKDTLSNLNIKTGSFSRYYKVTTTDKNGCTVTDSIFVGRKNLIQMDAGNDTSICYDSTLFISLNASHPNGTWTLPSKPTCINTNIYNVKCGGTGNHYINYTLTDPSGCINIDSINILVKPKPIVNIGPKSYCQGIVTNLNGPFIPAYTPNYSTLSLNNMNQCLQGLSLNTTCSGFGNFILKYSYTDSITGCSSEDTAMLIVLQAPSVSAGLYPASCAGKNVTLNGSPLNGTWDIQPKPQCRTGNIYNTFCSGSGTFSIKYTFQGSNGCFNRDSTVLQVDSMIVVEAGSYSPVCQGSDSIILNGTPPGGIWNGAGIFGNKFAPVNAGSSMLKYVVNNGACESIDSTQVNVLQQPLAEFVAGVSMGQAPLSVTFLNQSLRTTNYSWYFDDINGGSSNFSNQRDPVHVFTKGGVYSVRLVAYNFSGSLFCTDTMLKTNYITATPGVGIEEESDLYFSIYPNPAEDNFRIDFKNTGNYTIELFEIDGKKIRSFELKDTNFIQIDREKLPAGIYLITVSDKENFTIRKKISFR